GGRGCGCLSACDHLPPRAPRAVLATRAGIRPERCRVYRPTSAGGRVRVLDSSCVSVVVAGRGGERYLAGALHSILCQALPPGEVIVVDDGSTDATPRVLAGYGDRIRVMRQEPARGQFAASNVGVAASRGAVLGFLDADDLWTRSSIESRLVRLCAPDEP